MKKLLTLISTIFVLCFFLVSCEEENAQEHNRKYAYTVQAATCTTTGMDMLVCEDCGLTKLGTSDMISHDYDTVVTAPTCISTGYTTYTCKYCEHTYKDNYVDAL